MLFLSTTNLHQALSDSLFENVGTPCGMVACGLPDQLPVIDWHLLGHSRSLHHSHQLHLLGGDGGRVLKREHHSCNVCLRRWAGEHAHQW